MRIQIPADAPAGEWKVDSVSFRFDSGEFGGALELKDTPTFIVDKGEEFVKPKTALVEVKEAK